MQDIETVGAGVKLSADAGAGSGNTAAIAVKTHYQVECYRNGELIWADDAWNTVVNVGLDDLLDKYLKGSAYTAAFYVGLTDGTPSVAPGDTMSSHAGWTEIQNYTTDESPNDVRPALNLGSVSSQSVDNSADKCVYTITLVSPDSTTIGGAFITTDNTIGGTAGTLYSAAAFSAGDKVLNSGDTLNVTATLTAASA